MDPDLSPAQQVIADALADQMTDWMVLGAQALGIAVLVYLVYRMWAIVKTMI